MIKIYEFYSDFFLSFYLYSQKIVAKILQKWEESDMCELYNLVEELCNRN